MDPELFRQGDTLVLPFLITADGVIVNISDGTVVAELRVGSRVVKQYTDGNGLVVQQSAPEPELDQVPHGIITIDSVTTANLPLGNIAVLSLFYVNSAGVRMHAAALPLRGIA